MEDIEQDVFRIYIIIQEVSQGWLTVSVFGRPVPGGTEYLGSLQEEDWSLAVTFFLYLRKSTILGQFVD